MNQILNLKASSSINMETKKIKKESVMIQMKTIPKMRSFQIRTANTVVRTTHSPKKIAKSNFKLIKKSLAKVIINIGKNKVLFQKQLNMKITIPYPQCLSTMKSKMNTINFHKIKKTFVFSFLPLFSFCSPLQADEMRTGPMMNLHVRPPMTQDMYIRRICKED